MVSFFKSLDQFEKRRAKLVLFLLGYFLINFVWISLAISSFGFGFFLAIAFTFITLLVLFFAAKFTLGEEKLGGFFFPPRKW